MDAKKRALKLYDLSLELNLRNHCSASIRYSEKAVEIHTVSTRKAFAQLPVPAIVLGQYLRR
jgi:hypothetical protein